MHTTEGISLPFIEGGNLMLKLVSFIFSPGTDLLNRCELGLQLIHDPPCILDPV